jgi:hypothetical protein
VSKANNKKDNAKSSKAAKEAIKTSMNLLDMGGGDQVLTMNLLTRAIQNSMNSHQIKAEDAKKMAEHMLNFFGYSDRIIDNILQPDDRDVFYMMEDTGILTTEREETTLYDGREWRINYWLLRTNKIQELIRNAPKDDKKDKEDDSGVYTELPDEAWER